MGEPTDRIAERRFLMIGFAGFLLMLSGATTIVQGLWALDHKDDATAREAATQLSYANLETWGWIALFWGLVAVLASFAVFTRKPWGRWVGIATSSVSLVLAFAWVFAFPIAALAIIVIDLFVLYALFVYGGRDLPIA